MKVLIADDHSLIVDAYISILERNYKNYHFYIANSVCQAQKIIDRDNFDFAILDINFNNKVYDFDNSGFALARTIREKNPLCKIIFITSHTELLLLYDINKQFRPEGFISKVECTPDLLCECIDQIYTFDLCFQSPLIKNSINELLNSNFYLDSLNRQIIILISQGISTKNLHLHLPLSKSAIDKRKAVIKDFLNINGQSDEMLIASARNAGLI